MDDLLFQTTLMTARRLLKSRLRLFICRLKAGEPEENAEWRSVLSFEEGVEEEARTSWQNVRTRWSDTPICRVMLEAAAKLAFREAKLDVMDFFIAQDVDPKWLRLKIHKYRPVLD
jgi:hypothetical protein